LLPAFQQFQKYIFIQKETEEINVKNYGAQQKQLLCNYFIVWISLAAPPPPFPPTLTPIDEVNCEYAYFLHHLLCGQTNNECVLAQRGVDFWFWGELTGNIACFLVARFADYFCVCQSTRLQPKHQMYDSINLSLSPCFGLSSQLMGRIFYPQIHLCIVVYRVSVGVSTISWARWVSRTCLGHKEKPAEMCTKCSSQTILILVSAFFFCFVLQKV